MTDNPRGATVAYRLDLPCSTCEHLIASADSHLVECVKHQFVALNMYRVRYVYNQLGRPCDKPAATNRPVFEKDRIIPRIVSE